MSATGIHTYIHTDQSYVSLKALFASHSLRWLLFLSPHRLRIRVRMYAG